MTTLSNVLISTGADVLVSLFEASNDHVLTPGHLTISYLGDGDEVVVTATAKILGDDNQPGRYSGFFVVRYPRESFSRLTGGAVEFLFTTLLPVSFATLKAHLASAYGLVVEAIDVVMPGGGNDPVTDATMFTAGDTVDGVLSLKIADNSPRFIPFSSGGDSIKVRIVDPNGGELNLLAATSYLSSVTSMDSVA